jgi:hypothetical protein
VSPTKGGKSRSAIFRQTPYRTNANATVDSSNSPLWISTPEATAFDLIRYATRVGGIERAAETITALLPALRFRELRRVLAAEDEPTIAQRLGFIIEAGGGKVLADAVRAWLPGKLATVPLSPIRGNRRHFPIIERWQVLNNSGELEL